MSHPMRSHTLLSLSLFIVIVIMYNSVGSCVTLVAAGCVIDCSRRRRLIFKRSRLGSLMFVVSHSLSLHAHLLDLSAQTRRLE